MMLWHPHYIRSICSAFQLFCSFTKSVHILDSKTALKYDIAIFPRQHQTIIAESLYCCCRESVSLLTKEMEAQEFLQIQNRIKVSI